MTTEGLTANELIDKLVKALVSVKCDMYDSMPLGMGVCEEVEQTLALADKWRNV